VRISIFGTAANPSHTPNKNVNAWVCNLQNFQIIVQSLQQMLMGQLLIIPANFLGHWQHVCTRQQDAGTQQ
jgi:hypothetical protein